MAKKMTEAEKAYKEMAKAEKKEQIELKKQHAKTHNLLDQICMAGFVRDADLTSEEYLAKMHAPKGMSEEDFVKQGILRLTIGVTEHIMLATQNINVIKSNFEFANNNIKG